MIIAKFWRYIKTTYFFTSSFAFISSIIIIYSSIVFGEVVLLGLAFPCLIILFQKRSSARYRVLLFLSILLVYLSLTTLVPHLDFKSKQALESATLCGLAIKESKNAISIANVQINNKLMLENIRLSLSNEEVNNFGIKELNYFCLRGDFKFFQTNFGKAASISSGTLLYKFELLEEYKSILSELFITPIDKSLGDNSGLLKAMVLGIKDDLNDEDKAVFKELGLMHLLVASGANILIIIVLINRAFDLIKRHINLNTTMVIFLEVVVVSSYLLLVGLEGSLTRAFFFFVVLILSKITFRNYTDFHKLTLAVFLMILVFPGLVFTISFALSLSAVVFIIFSLRICDYYEINSDSSKTLVVSIIVPTLMLIPVSYFFGEVNLASIISNLLIVPMIEIFIVVGFGFVLLAFILSLLGLEGLLPLLGNLLGLLIEVVKFLNNVTLSLIQELNLMFYFKISNHHLLILIIFIIIVFTYISYSNYIRKVDSI